MTAAPPISTSYDVVIDLEVHLQLKTNAKMFCSCKNGVSGMANLHSCL